MGKRRDSGNSHAALEAKARELCLASGVNPDSRVAKGDSPRGMPAWCGFRGAARDFLNLAEQEAVAAAAAARRNTGGEGVVRASVIRGVHEPSTLGQFHECLHWGNTRAGALMADGHLGYTQPVGGVVAYEGQLSISGVGFDQACFTGDTRIFTLDGKTPKLADLDGKYVWVLSSDKDGTPIPARGICRKTRKSRNLVEVTLDNGEIIHCTDDHQFMLRNGSYAQVKDIPIGQSLMPFYRKYDKDGYVLVRNSFTKNLIRLHWLVFHAGLALPKLTDDKDELVIHHIDFDRGNNTPSNLQPMGKSAHDKMHTAMRNKAHFNTPDFTRKRIAAVQEFWKKAKTTDDGWLERWRNAIRESYKNHTDEWKAGFRESVKNNGKHGRVSLIRFNKNQDTIRKNRERGGIPRACPLCPFMAVSTSSLFYHARKAHPDALANGTRQGRHRGKNTVMERLILGSENHKVISIRPVEGEHQVYCLSVPTTGNFALASGIFVHNCGNMAIKLDTTADSIRGRLETIASDICKVIPFGVGFANDEKVDSAIFDYPELWQAAGMEDYRQKAAAQLGTCGSGNHYIDIFEDEAGAVWIGCHFGSRGLGHTATTRFLKAAGGKDGVNVPPCLVDADSPLGQSYIKCLELTTAYAYAGREWVCEKVRGIIGGRVVDSVHNNHNSAWLETHIIDGVERQLWVVRKGATPAFPGQRGFVGGSMGDNAVILEGVDSEESRRNLYSTVHGAGRVMGRKDAKRTLARSEMNAWLRDMDVILRGGDLDESPMAYRRLPDVLDAHAGTIRILHTLRPLVVVMAGSHDVDPWKD